MNGFHSDSPPDMIMHSEKLDRSPFLSPGESREENDSRYSLISQSIVEAIVMSEANTCHICNKKFGNSRYLTQHQKQYHGAVKPYKCEECGRKFEEESVFEEHRKKHDEEKPYKCQECPKQFYNKTHLRRHECVHTGEKPHKCKVCNKGFIRQDHMVKHMQKRHSTG